MRKFIWAIALLLAFGAVIPATKANEVARIVYKTDVHNKTITYYVTRPVPDSLVSAITNVTGVLKVNKPDAYSLKIDYAHAFKASEMHLVVAARISTDLFGADQKDISLVDIDGQCTRNCKHRHF